MYLRPGMTTDSLLSLIRMSIYFLKSEPSDVKKKKQIQRNVIYFVDSCVI